MAGLRAEEELSAFLAAAPDTTAVVQFGTSWCVKCHEIFPIFYRLSKQVGRAGGRLPGSWLQRVRGRDGCCCWGRKVDSPHVGAAGEQPAAALRTQPV